MDKSKILGQNLSVKIEIPDKLIGNKNRMKSGAKTSERKLYMLFCNIQYAPI